jgi:hypothetical protein
MDFCPQTWAGRLFAFVAVPALVIGAFYGPQTWSMVTASIQLPFPVQAAAVTATLVWLVAALVAWLALGVARGTHSALHRYSVARVALGGSILVALFVVGLWAGKGLGEAGCGRGKDDALAELIPVGGARATFSEDDLLNFCGGSYTTTAMPADVLAHHGAQLRPEAGR